MPDPTDSPRIQTPDTTKIQIVAIAQAIIAVAIAFGAPISDKQSVALIALAGTLGTVLIGADAAIRRARAQNADKLIPTQTLSATTTVDGKQMTASLDVPVTSASRNGSDSRDQLIELIKAWDDLRTILLTPDAPPPQSPMTGFVPPRPSPPVQ
jgi:hypothetical protein